MPKIQAIMKLKKIVDAYKQDNDAMEERISELEGIVKHNFDRLKEIKSDLETSERLIDLLRETAKYGENK